MHYCRSKAIQQPTQTNRYRTPRQDKSIDYTTTHTRPDVRTSYHFRNAHLYFQPPTLQSHYEIAMAPRLTSYICTSIAPDFDPRLDEKVLLGRKSDNVTYNSTTYFALDCVGFYKRGLPCFRLRQLAAEKLIMKGGFSIPTINRIV